MPDRHSTPARPSSTQRGDERVPRLAGLDLEATRAAALLDATPRVAIRTTVPGSPRRRRRRSSRRRGRAAARGAVGRADRLDDRVVGRGLDERPAGPPRRSVVSSLRTWARLTAQGTARARRNPRRMPAPPAADRAAAQLAAPRCVRGRARAPRPRLAVAARLALVAVEQVTVTGASGPDAARVRAALEGAARDMTTLHVRATPCATAVDAVPRVAPSTRAGLPAPPAHRGPRAHRRRRASGPAASASDRRRRHVCARRHREAARDRGAGVPAAAASRTPRVRARSRCWRRARGAARARRPRLAAAARAHRSAAQRADAVLRRRASACAAKWIAPPRVLATRRRRARRTRLRLPERPAAGGLAVPPRRAPGTPAPQRSLNPTP
jgi:hypothetical protein